MCRPLAAWQVRDIAVQTVRIVYGNGETPMSWGPGLILSQNGVGLAVRSGQSGLDWPQCFLCTASLARPAQPKSQFVQSPTLKRHFDLSYERVWKKDI